MMRFWEDNRIGGRPEYRSLAPDEVPAQVPDEIRKCVCFIYSEEADGTRVPRGTAFYVGLPLNPPLAGHAVYLITARHVLTGIKHRRPDGKFYIRLNLREGADKESAWFHTNVDHWTVHPDESLVDDTAAISGLPSPELVDFKFFPLEGIASEDLIEREAIGVGDEVFLPGLFVSHTGTERNIPIVRIGNIAAMPDEPVQTRIGPLKSYLVEARSIGGLSGSPVFVNTGFARAFGDSVQMGGGNRFYLLGLMHGHYQVTPARVAKADDVSDEVINMGIAVVPPVDRIMETLNHPRLQQMRDEAEKSAKEEHLPTMDSDEPGSEYERFEDLTKKLVNTPKEAIDEREDEPQR